MSIAEVTLGEHTLPVYAQRHAYLANRLGRFIDGLSELADTPANEALGMTQGAAYELLCVLIPALEKRIPEYEFRGFGSREAMDAGDYDPETDRSPTVPEIRQAFTVAATVNGFDILAHLKGLIDPKLVRSYITAQIAGALSETSPNSPSENGVSASMSSGTTDPTSTASED